MPCYSIIVLKPVNNDIASHIIDGDNWEAITALWSDISCIDSSHNEVNFTKQEAQKITSLMECFLLDMCYIKDGKTYMNDGDNQIYSAKAARAMLPFLKQCNGFTANWIDVNERIVDNYD